MLFFGVAVAEGSGLHNLRKTSGVGVLKGHGFPAVPKVFENDVRRGWKLRPFKAPVAEAKVFPQAIEAVSLQNRSA